MYARSSRRKRATAVPHVAEANAAGDEAIRSSRPLPATADSPATSSPSHAHAAQDDTSLLPDERSTSIPTAVAAAPAAASPSPCSSPAHDDPYLSAEDGSNDLMSDSLSAVGTTSGSEGERKSRLGDSHDAVASTDGDRHQQSPLADLGLEAELELEDEEDEEEAEDEDEEMDSRRAAPEKKQDRLAGSEIESTLEELLTHPTPASDAEAAQQATRFLHAHRMHRRYERRIIDLLARSSNMNHFLAAVPLKLLFGRFRDHRVRARYSSHLTEMCHRLVDLVPTMTYHTRVAIMIGICQGQPRPIHALVTLIVTIFSHDIEMSVANIGRLIRDFVSEPVAQRQLYGLLQAKGARFAEDHPDTHCLHVLSDIDDTFIHSGLGLGGPKYPKRTVLPGFLTLIKTLYARVIFITARPGFVEDRTRSSIRRKHGIDCAVLSGALRDSLMIPFTPAHCNSKIAARKLRNYERYVKLFPECHFLWFGDSGQGDIQTAIEMMRVVGKGCDHPATTGTAAGGPVGEEEAAAAEEVGGVAADVKAAADAGASAPDAHTRAPPGAMLGAFIQDVALSDGLTLKTSARERQRLRELNVHVVDNYAAVALIMCRDLGLLTVNGLRDVAQATVDDLVAAGPRFEHAQVYAERCDELAVALGDINDVLQRHELEPVMPPRPHIPGRKVPGTV